MHFIWLSSKTFNPIVVVYYGARSSRGNNNNSLCSRQGLGPASGSGGSAVRARFSRTQTVDRVTEMYSRTVYRVTITDSV